MESGVSSSSAESGMLAVSKSNGMKLISGRCALAWSVHTGKKKFCFISKSNSDKKLPLDVRNTF